MSLCIISFTEKGLLLSERIAKYYSDVKIYTKCAALAADEAVEHRYVEQAITEWAGVQMAERNPLLFIGACAIAVRAIAPWVTDKLCDSPVLVMDEKGEFVIPILSGHVGGANELARHLAGQLGATAVITTATDINEKFAVDLFAGQNRLHIVEREGIAKVSAKVLAGKTVTLSVETGHMDESVKLPGEVTCVSYPPEGDVDIIVSGKKEACRALITLRPKEYVIGMGCKRGKEPDKIEALIRKNLEEAGILQEQIYALASIDLKKDEEGFLVWSKKNRIPFLTFSAEELQEVPGLFQSSDFVKEQVGVDNVCERAALCACGKRGKIILAKKATDGMTIAIAKREWSVLFDGK